MISISSRCANNSMGVPFRLRSASRNSLSGSAWIGRPRRGIWARDQKRQKVELDTHVLSAQFTGDFKTDQRSQAMSEEGKGFVQQREQGLSQSLDQWREPRKGTLHQPSSPSGELNWTDLDVRGQATRPGAKNRRTASSIRETEQPQASLWPRLATCNPGIKNGVGYGLGHVEPVRIGATSKSVLR